MFSIKDEILVLADDIPFRDGLIGHVPDSSKKVILMLIVALVQTIARRYPSWRLCFVILVFVCFNMLVGLVVGGV